MTKPFLKPENPCFASGPAAKHKGWSYDLIRQALLGRSHRAGVSVQSLQEVLSLIKEILEIPPTHRVAIMPGSATGAVQSAMWSCLGTRPVDVLAWDVFGARWQEDVQQELRLPDVRIFGGARADFPNLQDVRFDKADVLFTWNGSTAGTCVPHGHWIPHDRVGLTLCDATSSAFVMPMDWDKLDVTAFSWQKGLGGEGGHGLLVVGPRAIQHLNTCSAPWPVPFMLNLRRDGVFNEALFQGMTLNTPSMMALEDFRQGLLWAQGLGGLSGLLKRVDHNKQIITKWVEKLPFLSFLQSDPTLRAFSTVCIKVDFPGFFDESHIWEKLKKMASLLEAEKAAYDCVNHTSGYPCLRIWAGPTVEADDLDRLFPWIEWAYHEVMADL